MPDFVRIPASAFLKDSDGFLSRECPVCERTFKVRLDGETESAGAELSDEEASAEADRTSMPSKPVPSQDQSSDSS